MTTTHPARHHASGDLEAVLVREFAAPRELVWAAHTRPEHVREWLLGPDGWTMPRCDIDLRPGGGWTFGWRRENGSELEVSGEYLEVEPPARLVQTESWGGEWAPIVTTIELTEIPGGTRLVNTMRWPTTQDRDAGLATGMDDGTARSYARLDDLLTRIG